MRRQPRELSHREEATVCSSSLHRKGATGRRSRSRVTLRQVDAWWRAADYLSVGRIYLLDNPLRREPPRREHLKPRLLGHWGTTPGLNFVYAHLNRVIRQRQPAALYIAGPGQKKGRSEEVRHRVTPVRS